MVLFLQKSHIVSEIRFVLHQESRSLLSYNKTSSGALAVVVVVVWCGEHEKDLAHAAKNLTTQLGKNGKKTVLMLSSEVVVVVVLVSYLFLQ